MALRFQILYMLKRRTYQRLAEKEAPFLSVLGSCHLSNIIFGVLMDAKAERLSKSKEWSNICIINWTEL